MNTTFTLRMRMAIRRRKLEREILETLSAEIKSTIIEFLLRRFTKIFVRIDRKKEQLQSLIQSNEQCLVETNTWGLKKSYTVPILSRVEVTRHIVRKWSFYVIGTLLLAIDTLFASMIIPFILPVTSDLTQVLLGFAVAVVVIVCCEIGLSNLAAYYEGQQLLKRNELELIDETLVQNKLRMAIIMLSIGFALTICIALVRFVFLETVPLTTGQLAPALSLLNDKMMQGSKYASAATFILAFVVILMFGWLSLTKKLLEDRYKVHKKHTRNDRKISMLHADIIVLVDRFNGLTNDRTAAAWSLMLHVFKLIKRKTDPENKEKIDSYFEETQRPDFVINEHIAVKYSKVLYADRALFIYDIAESRELRDMRQAINAVIEDLKPLVSDYKKNHHYKSTFSGAINMILLIFVSMLLTACQQKPQSINLITFVDLSKSIRPEVKSNYATIITTSINKLTPGSTMKVLSLDGATENRSRELISINVPPVTTFESRFDPPAQKLQLGQMRLKSFKDSVLKSITGELKQIADPGTNPKDSKSTDILGAFRLLNRYVINSDPSVNNMVLFLSDMLSSDKELDLEHHTYNVAQEAKILSHIKKDDFSAWHVAVLTGMTEVSPERYRSAKDFWLSYLSARKNKETIYESGAVSLVYAEIDRLTAPVKGI